MTVYQESLESESALLRRAADRRPIRGRCAPSPTGELHLGNASTALLAWLSVRAQEGRFVMRMEDLDRPRVRPGAAGKILGDLAWLGLDWDEGPDLGGSHAPYEQSLRGDIYEEAFSKLVESDRVYPCFCSRRDIAVAASAPQSPGDEVQYPGTCRHLRREEAADRIGQGHRHAWRFRVEGHQRPVFVDRVLGLWGADQPPPGDFVVRRSDGVASYQLAVVVDDDAMSISEVVRGDDLLASTGRQLMLFEALGCSPPCFAHVPLFLGMDGKRLSKRHEGGTIRELRDCGLSPEEIVGRLTQLLGIRHGHDPVRAVDLIDEFYLGELVSAPEGIRVDTSDWGPAPS